MAETVTLLGVTFDTDTSPGGTEFERDDQSGDESITPSAFFNDPDVTAGTAIITLEDEVNSSDTVGDGTADEVEIKN